MLGWLHASKKYDVRLLFSSMIYSEIRGPNGWTEPKSGGRQCVTNNFQVQSVWLMHYREPAPTYVTITTNLFYPRFQIIPSGHIDLFTSSSLYSSYTDFYLPQTVSK
jgi:hypothetical protein